MRVVVPDFTFVGTHYDWLQQAAGQVFQGLRRVSVSARFRFYKAAQ